MSSVRVDLNFVNDDGLLYAFADDVTSGTLRAGYMITIFEPEDGVSAPARVVSVADDGHYALLQVDWRAMTSQRTESPSFRVRRGAPSAVARPRIRSVRQSGSLRLRELQAA